MIKQPLHVALVEQQWLWEVCGMHWREVLLMDVHNTVIGKRLQVDKSEVLKILLFLRPRQLHRSTETQYPSASPLSCRSMQRLIIRRVCSTPS